MKNRKIFFTIILTALTLVSCRSIEDIRKYAATEVYPEDSILRNIANKKAMIVIAHDDDMCAMSGTISQLNKKGWKIAVVSFSRSVEQNAAHIKACSPILDTILFVELKPNEYRNDSAKGHHPIPRSAFDTVFNKSLITEQYLEKIQLFNPTIIFTLDNEVGAYGHPDHVFISQMVIDLTKERKIIPTHIYQSVYTNHMMTQVMIRRMEILEKWGHTDNWETAKKVYEVDGMPDPTVQRNITSEAELKMQYLRSYNKREKKSIDFFMPEFEKFKAKEYFNILDREFFRVIEVSDLQN